MTALSSSIACLIVTGVDWTFGDLFVSCYVIVPPSSLINKSRLKLLPKVTLSLKFPRSFGVPRILGPWMCMIPYDSTRLDVLMVRTNHEKDTYVLVVRTVVYIVVLLYSYIHIF